MSWKKTVIVLGLASFFTDLSSEMIYPLIPLFLSQALGASPLQLGLIEGIAESTSAIMKVFSGISADYFNRRKPIIIMGYGLSGLVRPLIGLASSWHSVLIVRFFDRAGKGIRTSPRDALIADVTSPENRGKAFGLHRSMDHAGAVIGPLMASSLIALFHDSLRQVFLLAAVPGIVTILILFFGIKEKDPDPTNIPEPLNLKHVYRDWNLLGTRYKAFLVAVVLFYFGNATDAFILLYLSKLGFTPVMIPIIWAAHGIVKMISSYYCGGLSDRIGHLTTIKMGWFLYAATYFAMGRFQDKYLVVAAFMIYGVFYGLSEPGERAIVANWVPKELKGTAYGFFHFLIGLMALPASLFFGLVWKYYGVQSAFYMGAGLAFCALGLLSRRCLLK